MITPNRSRTKRVYAFCLRGVLIVRVYLIAFVFLIGFAGCNDEVSAQWALRVIADSDRVHDQMLKVRVRDAVLPEVRKAVRFAPMGARTDWDVAVVRALRGAGIDVPVRVDVVGHRVRIVPFGMQRIETIRVQIGAGQGRNWWCTLMGTMCIVDGARDGREEEPLYALVAPTIQAEQRPKKRTAKLWVAVMWNKYGKTKAFHQER